MKHEYENGGKVEYDGDKYYIDHWWVVAHEGTWLQLKRDSIGNGFRVHASLTSNYEPPKKEEVFEWITEDDFRTMYSEFAPDLPSPEQQIKWFNEYLTAFNGDPTVRTYNGEKAEEFGLTDESSVLIWEMEQWEMYRFRGIGKDDKWRKLPAAPNTGNKK